MRILGPNVVGTLSNSDKLNASFAPFLPLKGSASLVSQSGALLIAMDAITYTRRIGFDKLISIGNMSDLNFADMINYLMKMTTPNASPSTSKVSRTVTGSSRKAEKLPNRSLCSNLVFPNMARPLPLPTQAHWLVPARFILPLPAGRRNPGY